MANTTPTDFAVNSTINFGTIVRRYGCCVGTDGNTPTVNAQGYYDIDTNFTFIPDSAGLLTITLYKNGVAIPGSTATWSVGASTTYNMSIPAIIRHCCDCPATITAVVTGVDGEMRNASILIEKI